MDLTNPAGTRRETTRAAGGVAARRSAHQMGVSGNQATAPLGWAASGEEACAGSVKRRRYETGPLGLLARVRRGRSRRSQQVPDLPGQWHSPRWCYQIARERVVEHDDGWAAPTCDPGHRFVSWELAVRYEAAAHAARLHYTQICDLAGDDECRERLDRITGHLDEMRRLSEIERAVRPMLGADPKFLKALSSCPRPLYSEPPPEPRLKDLAREHLGDLLPTLERVIALQASGAPFQPEALKLLVEADQTIRGAGTHTSVFVDDRRYDFPFDADFESVIRPLRYSLAELGSAYAQATSARSAVQTAAGHLEGCLKALCGGRHSRKPLGALLKHTPDAAKRLDGDLRNAMIRFTDQAANPAKHDFTNTDGPIPLFSFADAVYAHYLARRFGAAVLDACGQLDPLIAAVDQAAERDSIFFGGPLSIPPPTRTTADQHP